MRSKRTGKPVFFVVFALILALAFTAFFGISDYYGDTKQVYLKGANEIRWGIDIKGCLLTRQERCRNNNRRYGCCKNHYRNPSCKQQHYRL